MTEEKKAPSRAWNNGLPTNRRRGKGKPPHEDPAPADAIFVVYCDGDPKAERVQGRDAAYARALERANKRRDLGLKEITCGFMLLDKWNVTPHEGQGELDALD